MVTGHHSPANSTRETLLFGHYSIREFGESDGWERRGREGGGGGGGGESGRGVDGEGEGGRDERFDQIRLYLPEQQ